MVIIAAGVYFIWSLFHKENDSEVDKCVNGTAGDTGEVKHWFCQKGFDVVRILVVVVFVIIWIFQLGESRIVVCERAERLTLGSMCSGRRDRI